MFSVQNKNQSLLLLLNRFHFFCIGILFFIKMDVAFAQLPDFELNRSFRERLSAALAESASSFDLEQDQHSVTYVLGSLRHFRLAQEGRSQYEFRRLLMNDQVKFKVTQSRPSGESIISIVRVSFPTGTLPQFFEFSLTPLNIESGETLENLEVSDGLKLDKSMKMKLRIRTIQLMKQYADLMRINPLVDNIFLLDSYLKNPNRNLNDNPNKTSEHELMARSNQEMALEELAQIGSPMRRINYIKETITPTEYSAFPDLVFLKLLQEQKVISPALSQEALGLKTAQVSPDLTSEEARNCLELGGQIELYTTTMKEAYLCRIGEAGIGASSLLHFKEHQKVDVIDAFLQSVPPEPNISEEVAVVPYGKSEPGQLGKFVLRSIAPDEQKLQAGMRFMAGPGVKVSQYCRQRGGKPTQLRHASNGTSFKACIFNDFSGVDANTLWKGTTDPSNRALVSVLQRLIDY